MKHPSLQSMCHSLIGGNCNSYSDGKRQQTFTQKKQPPQGIINAPTTRSPRGSLNQILFSSHKY
ncbi:hypothetical protein Mapa_010986 [Marchantia paleacea]|nr:hypothetical protein Mapa_010986 [Marchantia paleacea]